MLKHLITGIVCAFFMTGCTSNLEALRKPEEGREYDLSFPKVAQVEREQVKFKDAAEPTDVMFVRFSIKETNVDCVVFPDKELAADLPTRLNTIISSVGIEFKDNTCIVKKISLGLGVYGTLQYWFGYAW